MSFSHTSTPACSFVSPRPDAVDEHPHAEASGGSLTRLTLGRGDRLDVGFSSPPLSKGGHLALGCLRGTDLGKIDRRLHRVVHEIRQQELRGQRDHLDDVGVGPPASYWASDTPPRASMRAFANATAACRFGSPERPCRFSAISFGGTSPSSSRRSCARQGRRRTRWPPTPPESSTATLSGQPSPRGRSG